MGRNSVNSALLCSYLFQVTALLDISAKNFPNKHLATLKLKRDEDSYIFWKGGLMCEIWSSNYDADSKEADVLFSNDTLRFLCYADALDDINKLNVGAYVFSAFMASDIERAETAFRIEKTEVSYYSHRLQGIFIGNSTMQIGEWIFLSMGTFPEIYNRAILYHLPACA